MKSPVRGQFKVCLRGSIRSDQKVDFSHIHVMQLFQRALDLRLIGLGIYSKNQYAVLHLLCGQGELDEDIVVQSIPWFLDFF